MNAADERTEGLLARNAKMLIRAPCVRPLQQRAERLNVQTGEVSAETWQISCGSRWEAVCPPCAARKARDTWLVATSGLIPLNILKDGAGSTPSPLNAEHVIFLTLTAPSFGRVHRTFGCPCQKKHRKTDQNVGCPLDWRKYRFKEQAIWNAMASRLFSRTIDRLRRSHSGDLEYFGVTEFQKRQAVHFHVLVKSSSPFVLADVLRHVRDVRIYSGIGNTGQEIRWGAEANVQNFSATESSHLTTLDNAEMGSLHYVLKAVKYLHKDHAYAATDSRLSKRIARFADRLETIGERVRNSGQLAGLKPLKRMPLGGGAGFTGQRVKKSKGWGLLTYAILAQNRRNFKVSFTSDGTEVLRIGAPYSLSLEEVQTRRAFPDALAASLRVLATRVATYPRGDPPALAA